MLKDYFAKKVTRNIAVVMSAERRREFEVEVVGVEDDRLHGAVAEVFRDVVSGRKTVSHHIGTASAGILEWMDRDDAVAAVAVAADYGRFDAIRSQIADGWTLRVLSAVDRERETGQQGGAADPEPEADRSDHDFGPRGDPWQPGRIPAFPLNIGGEGRDEVLEGMSSNFEDEKGRDFLPRLWGEHPDDPDLWFYMAIRERDPARRLRMLETSMRLAWSKMRPHWFAQEPRLYSEIGGRVFTEAIECHAITLLEMGCPADAYWVARVMYRYDAYRFGALLPMAAAAATTREPEMLAFVRAELDDGDFSGGPWLWAAALVQHAIGDNDEETVRKMARAMASNSHVADMINLPAMSIVDWDRYSSGSPQEAAYILSIQHGAWRSLSRVEDLLAKAQVGLGAPRRRSKGGGSP